MQYKFNLGKNIQQIRQRKGLSQEQLSELLDMSAHHLSSIERGAHLPRLDKLILLMNVLDCSPNQIFRGDVKAVETADNSNLFTRLSSLPGAEQERILAVLSVLIETSPESKKPS